MSTYEIQGRVIFGNIRGVESFTFTRSRGVRPSVAQLVVPQLPLVPTGSAPLIFNDGVRHFVIPDCHIQSVDISTTNGFRYVVSIADYRWRWEKFGAISGQYNLVRGGLIVPETRKNPQEMARLCLQEMQVRDFDVRNLPTDVYPEVIWSLDNPANALESLCNSLGYVVCPELSGRVAIHKAGVGKVLPVVRGGEINQSIKVPMLPDEIWVAAAPTVWEMSLKIGKKMALEFTDERDKVESLVFADDVSYKPEDGWGTETPRTMPNIGVELRSTDDKEKIRKGERIRSLAMQSVYRMFGFDLPIKVFELPFKIEDNNQLVLASDLLSTVEVSYNSTTRGEVKEIRREQPFVYGMFAAQNETGKNNVEKFSHDYTKDKTLRYERSFSIDPDRVIISFSDPFYMLKELTEDDLLFSDKVYFDPEAYVRTAFSVRDPDTGDLWREVYKIQTGANNRTKPLWVVLTDVRREIRIDATTGKPFKDGDNKKDVEKALREYARIEFAKLNSMDPAVGEYAGFQDIELDGAIEQVTYVIDSSGMTSTTASYGTEHSYVVASFEERRRVAKLNEILKQQDQIKNDKKDVKR